MVGRGAGGRQLQRPGPRPQLLPRDQFRTAARRPAVCFPAEYQPSRYNPTIQASKPVRLATTSLSAPRDERAPVKARLALLRAQVGVGNHVRGSSEFGTGKLNHCGLIDHQGHSDESGCNEVGIGLNPCLSGVSTCPIMIFFVYVY